MKNASTITLAALNIFSLGACAHAEETKPAADMSDPLAVYTQAGIGATNKGLNLKIGQSYDTGSDTTMAMRLLEVKGFGGEGLGWDSNSERDNSIDSIRFRSFSVDMTNGRGLEYDANWNFDNDAGRMNVSMIQALPKMGRFQFFPLAGAGVVLADGVLNTDGDGHLTGGMGTDGEWSGYSLPGLIGVVGMYSKIEITDRIWLNYNPMYTVGLSGKISDESLLAHEFAASYQLNPRQNIRLYANWNENVDFTEGDFRVEFNHQF